MSYSLHTKAGDLAWYVLIPWLALDTWLMKRRQLEHPDMTMPDNTLIQIYIRIDHVMSADQKLLDPEILFTCELWLCYK